MSQRARIWAWRLLAVVVVGAGWETAARLSPGTAFFLASPSEILLALRDMSRAGTLMTDTSTTAQEALAGLLIGTAVGTLFGLSLWLSDTAAKVTRPFILILGTLPVFAVAPLLIVWFGIGFRMKVALATLATVFLTKPIAAQRPYPVN